ncbi:MAG: hypothetical protein WC785_00145 [Tatlockia sp.]|jgi:hypothetical protein
MNVQALLNRLSERLPELEWKVNGLGATLPSKSLPKGVFRDRLEMTAASCIAEIKADLQTLATHHSERSSYYLAQKIQQKITILVTLCHIKNNKPKKEERVHFGVQMISTRQQWLKDLEQTIDRLTAQQKALKTTYQQMQSKGGTALLQLQAELGEVEKRLTLAKEALGSV